MKYLFMLSLALCLLNLGLALWARELPLVGAWLSATLGWGIACMEHWSNS
jgi:hypothetical protein